jgi:acyl carrier protein
MTRSETKQRIRSFLSKYVRDDRFEDDTDLFGSGRLNSLFAMELVLFVEERFGMIVENEDLEINNFRSIDAIASFIERKRQPPASFP